MSNHPRLSILIPAYNFAYGVNRILEYLSKTIGKNDCIEVIISDNSLNDSVEKCCMGYDQKINLKYFKKEANQCPASNWNNLINISKGDYIHFLHHDEMPYEFDFYDSLLQALEPCPNVVVLNCNTISCWSNFYSPIIPTWFKRIFLRFFPKLIFYFNVIGSPSNIVVSKKFTINFDESLRWIVDVDWFYRVFILSKESILYSKNNSILSIKYNSSITRNISAELKKINADEISYIKAKYNFNINILYLFFVFLAKMICRALRFLNLFQFKKYVNS
jgi:hypothetical protein